MFTTFLRWYKFLDFIGKDYPNYGVFLTVGEAETVTDLIVQYKETDWAFAKRLVSRLNSFLVPDYVNGSGKYYFGMPKRNDQKSIDSSTYTIYKDVGEYIDKTGNGVNGLAENDAVYYRVKDREIYDLGDNVSFQGESLMIHSIETYLEGNELVHYYSLKSEAGFQTRELLNERIIGASLEGEIIEVKTDQVKVHVKCDDTQEKAKEQANVKCDDTPEEAKAKEKATAKWFSFSTVYSSPDGTGWYFMPEEGDRVRLYFPGTAEQEGYVISATHLVSSDANARANPDNKSLKTKWGKEVLLTPDSIILSTNENRMRIELSDQKGINIISDKEITIVSDKSIAIASLSEEVQVTADKNINMKQGSTQLNLNKDVVFATSQLNVQN